MQAEEGGDWSTLLCNRNPESFVDVYSPQDNYSAKTLGFFPGLDGVEIPGGENFHRLDLKTFKKKRVGKKLYLL